MLRLDLDCFKHVNDTLGHSTGDALLRVVTERLCACVVRPTPWPGSAGTSSPSSCPASAGPSGWGSSVLLQDNEATLKTLHGLRNLGVWISMDNFGAGFSSLSYLCSFPFDKIKIDRSFVRDLPHDGDCLAIVRAVVGLGVGLSMVTTAEGIETLEQFEMLRSEGCTEVQGYFLGRPGPGAGVTALLAGDQGGRLRGDGGDPDGCRTPRRG